MTREQIVGEFVLGIVLIIVGIVLQPLLKKIWAWMNKQGPLDAKSKGRLYESLSMTEDSLKRLDHLSAHPKDLFLYLIQLVLATFFSLIVAFCLYVFSRFMPAAPSYLPIILVFVCLAAVFCVVGLVEANRLSDKKIDDTRQGLQKTIDDIRKKLSDERLLNERPPSKHHEQESSDGDSEMNQSPSRHGGQDG